MARSLAVLAAIAAVTAACGSSAPPSAGNRPPATAGSGGVIRGERLPSYACPTGRTASTGAQVTVAPSAVTGILLCPLSSPLMTGRLVRLTPTDVGFDSLTRALALPDQSPSPGVCPMYADVPQTVVADTADGALLVHIPVDACRHFLRYPLGQLQELRSQRPTLHR